MAAPLKFLFRDQTFWLSRERCIYWEDNRSLILSDLHLGKSGHFRKAGIAVPQSVFVEDMQRLLALVQFFKPEQLLIAGDLFHSSANKEHDLFLKWRQDIAWLPIHLIAGNHDILNARFYSDAGITVTETFKTRDFTFIHDIAGGCDDSADGSYTFCGHIHPGISLSGPGKQSLRFPCFYFGEKHAVLPAFGKFTGTYLVAPKHGDHIFAILPQGNGAGLMKVY